MFKILLSIRLYSKRLGSLSVKLQLIWLMNYSNQSSYISKIKSESEESVIVSFTDIIFVSFMSNSNFILVILILSLLDRDK